MQRLTTLVNHYSNFEKPEMEGIECTGESDDGKHFDLANGTTITNDQIMYAYQDDSKFFIIPIVKKVQEDIPIKLVKDFIPPNTILTKSPDKPHIYIDSDSTSGYYQIKSNVPIKMRLVCTSLVTEIPSHIDTIIGDNLMNRAKTFHSLQREYIGHSNYTDSVKTKYWDVTFMSDLASNIVYWYNHDGDARVCKFLQIMNIAPTETMTIRQIIASILIKIFSISNTNISNGGNKLFKIAVFNAMNYSR